MYSPLLSVYYRVYLPLYYIMIRKNLLCAYVVATLLVGVVFFINKTWAETAQLSLSIVAWGISDCTSATGLNLGGTMAGPVIKSLSGNAWIGPDFGCNDLQGATGWNFSMSSTDLSGIPQWTIPASNISLSINGNITVTTWACASVTTGAGGILDTAKNLITKNNGYWEICSFYLPNTQATITVSIPAWSPVGIYSSILTIIYPS